MKVLQINTTVNTSSTGRIMEEIGQQVLENGHESFVAYRKAGPSGSQSKMIKIGNEWDRYLHALKTRIFDLHGFGSKRATRDLVEEIDSVDPDVIGMHNLHGYYLNIEILFNYLKSVQKPIVWTFHDCWAFTGHCTYFDSVNCERWKSGCFNCPIKKNYPASYGLDNSKWNYEKKKELFTGLDNLTIVTPSQWLKELVKQSFLKNNNVRVIHNGIDTNIFSPGTSKLPGNLDSISGKIILGVASVWDRRKGLEDFVKLAKILEKDYQVVLVGLNNDQIKELPTEIIGIERTENVEELASIYSAADVFVNPTWVDNFPTTNIEALACGTPVITYRTGGSPEAVDDETGFVVDQGDVAQIKKLIETIFDKGNLNYSDKCRERALQLFDKKDRYHDYVSLYRESLN